MLELHGKARNQFLDTRRSQQLRLKHNHAGSWTWTITSTVHNHQTLLANMEYGILLGLPQMPRQHVCKYLGIGLLPASLTSLRWLEGLIQQRHQLIVERRQLHSCNLANRCLRCLMGYRTDDESFPIWDRNETARTAIASDSDTEETEILGFAPPTPSRAGNWCVPCSWWQVCPLWNRQFNLLGCIEEHIAIHNHAWSVYHSRANA